MNGDVRGFKRLKTVLESTAFVHDVESIRQSNDEDYMAETYALVSKYGLLQTHYPIIEALVLGSSLEEALSIRPDPVAQIVNHNEKTIQPADDPRQIYDLAKTISKFQTSVVIQLNSDASKDEIINFIEENYASHIQPALVKYKRVHNPFYSSRDEDIKKEKLNGVSVQKLSDKYNISVPRIYQILKGEL